VVSIQTRARVAVNINGFHAGGLEEAKQKAIFIAKSQRESAGFGQMVLPALVVRKTGVSSYDATVILEADRKKMVREVLY